MESPVSTPPPAHKVGDAAAGSTASAAPSSAAACCGSHACGVRRFAVIVVLTLLAVVILSQVVSTEPPPTSTPRSQAQAAQAGEPPIGSHPLDKALALAYPIQKRFESDIADYTATLVKQERIGDKMQPEEIFFVKVRSQPFSAYLKCLSPANLKGTEAIYVEGANDGKLIGHAGSGLKALLGPQWLEPTGMVAMMGQRYPITEIGIANLTKRLIEVGEHDRRYGDCVVTIDENTKVGDRPCICVSVLHPVKRPGFLFYLARIYLDKELQLPIHYEAYDWPAPGHTGPPPMLERYTYTRLKLNPGLTDADFDPNNPLYNFVTKK